MPQYKFNKISYGTTKEIDEIQKQIEKETGIKFAFTFMGEENEEGLNTIESAFVTGEITNEEIIKKYGIEKVR